MNCYNHIELVAVSTCRDCQKGLCSECSHKYESPICTQCNMKRIKEDKKAIYKEFAMTFIGGFIIYFLMSSGETYEQKDFSLKIFSLFVSFGVISGWRTLSRITPSVFLFLPLIGWAIYFMIKFMLSLMIGWFMLPIRIVKNIKRLNDLKNIPT